MTKYKKKPVIIDAEQWEIGKQVDGVITECLNEIPDDVKVKVHTGQFGAIKTLEGWYVVTPTDWIITGVKGEKYPCRDDIFRQTYDKVE